MSLRSQAEIVPIRAEGYVPDSNIPLNVFNSKQGVFFCSFSYCFERIFNKRSVKIEVRLELRTTL